MLPSAVVSVVGEGEKLNVAMGVPRSVGLTVDVVEEVSVGDVVALAVGVLLEDVEDVEVLLGAKVLECVVEAVVVFDTVEVVDSLFVGLSPSEGDWEMEGVGVATRERVTEVDAQWVAVRTPEREVLELTLGEPERRGERLTERVRGGVREESGEGEGDVERALLALEMGEFVVVRAEEGDFEFVEDAVAVFVEDTLEVPVSVAGRSVKEMRGERESVMEEARERVSGGLREMEGEEEIEREPVLQVVVLREGRVEGVEPPLPPPPTVSSETVGSRERDTVMVGELEREGEAERVGVFE